jgi:SNARE protein
MSRLKNISKSYKMETRLIKEGASRRKHEDAHEAYDKKIKGLESEIKWSRTEGNKKELFGGASAATSPAEEGDAMLQEASRVQDKTEQSLAHTRAVVDATKEVGNATLEELHRQRDQIKDITEEVMLIEDNLSRADKLIKTFGRRMATDRFIQCFACVNVLLLVGVIVYAVVSKEIDEGNINVPDQPFRYLRGA